MNSLATDSELFDIAASLAYIGDDKALRHSGGMSWALHAHSVLTDFGCLPGDLISLSAPERAAFYQLVALVLRDEEDSEVARVRESWMLVR